MPKQERYVAFLRGINVGGHKTVKMDELKKAFEQLGFQNVKTLLASGNIVFDAAKQNQKTLSEKISEKLERTFGHEIGVIIRSVEEIKSLVDSNPFKVIKVTPETRLYVTFLAEKSKSTLKIPYSSPDGGLKILSKTDTELCSHLVLLPTRSTVDYMSVIEKEFGKKVTTRNWNTVLKILK